MRRLAVVASHPIQYQAPWFRALADVCDLTVFFAHRQSAAGQARAGFGQEFDWDIPLLDGYRHEFLKNVAPAPGVDRYAGCDTPGILRRLQTGRFDACLVNGWYLKAYVQAIRATRTLGIRLLLRGDSHLGEPRSLLRRSVKYLPYRVLLGRADAHLYVGRANYEYLRHYGVPESRLYFAPHFVDTKRFGDGAESARRSGEAAARRAAWGVDPASRVLLFVGKFTPIKRAQDLIEAIAILKTRGHRVHGVCVGSGPEERALRALALRLSAPVAFAGFQNQAAMPSCYAAADALVVCSSSESWGLVVNEAMSAGLPAIVSDRVGCAADLVEHGRTGWVYKAGDVAALVSALTAALTEFDRRGDALQSAVRTRIGRYTCENAVTGTLAALEGAVDAAAPAPLAARADHV